VQGVRVLPEYKENNLFKTLVAWFSGIVFACGGMDSEIEFHQAIG
jgi:hypothetical protein